MDDPRSVHQPDVAGGRLRQQPNDEVAWDQFVERYGKVYTWCRHWRLPDADAEDVVQIVLTKLAEQMRTFAYDHKRSFRGRPADVAVHAGATSSTPGNGLRNGRRRRPGATGKYAAARDDLLSRLAEQFDQEILEEATVRVDCWCAGNLGRLRRPLDRVPKRRAAARLNLQVASVYQAKSRVQMLLREEIRQLEGNDE